MKNSINFIYKSKLLKIFLSGITAATMILAMSFYVGAYDDPANIDTAFISRCYTKALGRCGDIGGIENWVGYLNRGEQSPAQIAFGFVFSSEMQNKNLTDYQYVEMLYELCFNREGDPGGINNWLNHLANGASRQDVFNGFVTSQEFANTVASFGL